MENINFSWEILGITKKTIGGIEDVVFSVIWRKLGVDEVGNIGEFRTMLNLEVPGDIDSGNFIPYNNLTKDIMISWIKNKINEEDVDLYILDRIQECKDKLTVVVSGNFPWQISQ